MSTQIIDQINTFILSIFLGMICEFIYDVIRIFRRVLKKNMIVTVIEDFIYWIVVAIMLFILLYRENGGMIRGFAIVGMGFGMYCFEELIGVYFVKYISIFLIKVINIVKKGINKITKLLFKLLKKIIKPITIFIIAKGKKIRRYSEKKFEQRRGVRVEKKREKEKRKRKQVKLHGRNRSGSRIYGHLRGSDREIENNE